MPVVTKKIFKHGGSDAVDLPKDFTKSIPSPEVIVEYSSERILIRPKTELDSLESDPLFKTFIQGIAADAMRNPDRLREMKEIWDEEWDELLEGVSVDDDE